MDTKLNKGQMALLEQVARRAINQILPQSIEQRKEYGGMIYMQSRLFIAMPAITQGDPTKINVGQDKPNCGCPGNTTPIAYYHTHPTFSVGGLKADYEEFSDDDKDVARDHQIHAFVGTLAGTFLRYDYQTDKVSLILGKLNNQTK